VGLIVTEIKQLDNVGVLHSNAKIVKERRDRQTDRQTHRQTHTQTDRTQTHTRRHKQKADRTSGKTDKQADRKTEYLQLLLQHCYFIVK
jgi:hypothetical protein